MSPFIANLATRLFDFSGAGRSQVARVALLILLHLVALAILIGTETRLVSQLAFVLSWVFYNFFWIVLLRRPTVAAAMALTFLALLILLSQFKHHVLLMTVNFVDLMMIDADTLAFLMQVFPHLDAKAALAASIVLLALAAVWRFDTVRMGRYVALLGATASLACLVGVSLAVPSDPWEESYNENYFSKFMRSGVTRIPFAVIDTGRGQDYALNATGFLDLILTGHDHDLFINYDERGTVVELSYDAHRIVVVDVTIAW